MRKASSFTGSSNLSEVYAYPSNKTCTEYNVTASMNDTLSVIDRVTPGNLFGKGAYNQYFSVDKFKGVAGETVVASSVGSSFEVPKSQKQVLFENCAININYTKVRRKTKPLSLILDPLGDGEILVGEEVASSEENEEGREEEEEEEEEEEKKIDFSNNFFAHDNNDNNNNDIHLTGQTTKIVNSSFGEALAATKLPMRAKTSHGPSRPQIVDRPTTKSLSGTSRVKSLRPQSVQTQVFGEERLVVAEREEANPNKIQWAGNALGRPNLRSQFKVRPFTKEDIRSKEENVRAMTAGASLSASLSIDETKNLDSNYISVDLEKLGIGGGQFMVGGSLSSSDRDGNPIGTGTGTGTGTGNPNGNSSNALFQSSGLSLPRGSSALGPRPNTTQPITKPFIYAKETKTKVSEM